MWPAVSLAEQGNAMSPYLSKSPFNSPSEPHALFHCNSSALKVTSKNSNLKSSATNALVALLERATAQLEATEISADFAGGSTLGYVRKENQDRYLVASYSHSETRRSFRVAVIADGVGSLPESGLAASTAIAVFVSSLISEMDYLPSNFDHRMWESSALVALQLANDHVFNQMGDRGASTLSAVIVPALGASFGVHVGDSKVFAVTKDFRLTQISIDQTVGSQLKAMGYDGSTASSGHDPRLARSLAQYIGMSDPLRPQVITLGGNWDSVLLATDGISLAKKVLSEEGWKLLSQQAKSRSDLIKKILHICNWLGGADNTSMVIIPAQYGPADSSKYNQAVRLTAFYGAHTMELQKISDFRAPYPNEIKLTTNAEKKRVRLARSKRSPKQRSSASKYKAPETKSSPSVVFLPGLGKDENVTRDPGSL